MKLEFRLLVVDDNPNSVDEAVHILKDHLSSKGFTLKCTIADDLSPRGLTKLAQREGLDYDLVIVDYNLGRSDSNGSDAASNLRHQLPYTDIIFYSSNAQLDLLSELAARKVAGVFVAYRTEIGDALVGIANTIISKAIDLNHMRGIAMAEVSDIDLVIEECLHAVFSSRDECFEKKAAETLADLLERAEAGVETLKPIVAEGKILDVVGNGLLFSSSHKFWALRRVAKCLDEKPVAALEVLATYETDVISSRNTLAHAKENEDEEGVVTLRSVKANAAPIVIDDAWMSNFRSKLHTHKAAIVDVCGALATRSNQS